MENLKDTRNNPDICTPSVSRVSSPTVAEAYLHAAHCGCQPGYWKRLLAQIEGP